MCWSCRGRLLIQEHMPLIVVTGLATVSSRTTKEDGTIELASSSMRRGWWVRYGSQEFPIMAAAARRLLSAHATTAAAERNWSSWGKVYVGSRSRLKISKAEKLIFIKNNQNTTSRRRDYELSLDVLGMDSDQEDDM